VPVRVGGSLDSRRHGQDRAHRVEPGHDLGGNRRLAPVLVRQRAQVTQVAPQVEQRHHRETVADERIVGVVPLRALGVHPDPAARHEVRQLRQRRHEQLLQQRDDDDPTVSVDEQLAVATERATRS
jgi:hypothetical protein